MPKTKPTRPKKIVKPIKQEPVKDVFKTIQRVFANNLLD